MAEHHRSSIVGAFILMGLGALFLYSNSHPEANPWPLLARYWPLLLIFVGVGKLWDYYYAHSHPGQARGLATVGEVIAVVLIVLFVAAMSRYSRSPQNITRQHETIDYGAAQSAQVYVQMPEGNLQVSSGSSKLLDADLGYSRSLDDPKISYSLDGTNGQLNIKQGDDSHSNIHIAPGWGGGDNDWKLHLGNRIPMELKIEIGAGRGDLRLGDLPLTKLDLQMGAGSVTADLRGNWQHDLDAHIQGGVGNATIRLPKDIGVEVHAEGGIGSVNAHGLSKDGDHYVNDAYGKSPVTLKVHVEGGVGSIDLIPEM
jgi:hypothetical protein